MSQFVFTKKRDLDNPHDNSTIEVTFDATSLDEMCEALHDFLAACGFQVQHFAPLQFQEKDEE